MAARNLIVVGGSAGGVEALMKLAPHLSAELNAAICIVIHFPPQGPSLLPQLLRRRAAMVVELAMQDARLEAGHIYVAPPDWHLLIQGHTCALSHGPREHGYRPSIDALFRSAAEAFGRNTIGVVLSGSLDDGSAGLRHIRLLGGKCVVQDPRDATFPGMPSNAMSHLAVDRSVPIRDMGAVLQELVAELDRERDMAGKSQSAPNANETRDPLQATELDPPDPALELEDDVRTQRLVLRCPECGGVLQETIDEGLAGFRCRVGHHFSLLSLLEAQGMALEQELWATFNGLLERIDLCRRLVHSARQNHLHDLETEFEQKANDAKGAADMLRDLLLRGTLFHSVPSKE